MMHRLLLTLLIAFSPLAKADSALPDCPTDQSAVFDNCFGTYTWPDGKKYVGDYKDNKAHGQGTLTSPDGGKYVGEWEDDKFNGQGTHTWPDGMKYVGEFKDDKQHGQGTLTSPDGGKYVGEWEDDKFNGRGTFTFPDKIGGSWNGYFMNGDFVPNICTNMGLTKGSPEHGKCVLKLMDSVMSEED